MKRKEVYRIGECSIHEAKTGHIITINSNVTGQITCRKVLVKYIPCSDYAKGTDFSAAHNDCMTIGQVIISIASERFLPKGYRVIRRGFVVDKPA